MYQLHEAVRSGQTKVVEFLIKSGVDVNHLSIDGKSPLRRAINDFGENHEITLLLKSKNAKDVGDDEADTDETDDEIGDIDYFDAEEESDDEGEDSEDEEEDENEPMSDDEDL